MIIDTRIPGIKKLRLVEDWILSRFRQHVLILGYHRVADNVNDPYGICVSARHFQEQMDVLHRFAKVVRLQELIEGIKTGQLPHNCVALTFDDGYSDLLYTVKPVLNDYKMPSTVFIVTGYIGHEFWWDELERLVWASNLEKKASPGGLRYQQLLYLPPIDRQRAMEELRELAASTPIENSKSRAMTLDELVELANGKLFEIGSHGVNHTSLGQLTVDEQKSELAESKAFLENCLGVSIHSFSYPNGSYSSISLKLACESGYNCACKSKPGTVFHHSDLYQLPRFWIPDWDGVTFKRWLLKWL